MAERATAAQHPTGRAERRAAIIKAAYDLIAERGLEGFRFADVARAAGINNGTLLYYFASKDEIVQAVGGFLVEQFMEGVPPGEIPPEDDPRDRLREEFADAQTRMRSNIGLVFTELVVRAQRDPAVAQMLVTIEKGWHGYLLELFLRGRDLGIFRTDLNPEHVVTTITSAIRGAGMQALVVGNPDLAAGALRSLARMIEEWIAFEPEL